MNKSEILQKVSSVFLHFWELVEVIKEAYLFPLIEELFDEERKGGKQFYYFTFCQKYSDNMESFLSISLPLSLGITIAITSFCRLKESQHRIMTEIEKQKQTEIHICSETRLKKIAAKLKWLITDFYSLSSDRNKKRFPVLESSTFLLRSNNKDKSFKVSFQYDYRYLQITSTPEFPKDVENVCSILDKDDKNVWRSKMFIPPLYRVRLPVETLLRDKQKYLSNNTLKILFEIEIIEDLVTEYTTDSNVTPAFSNLERFLEDQSICDVTFFIGDQEFRAHKIILAARSPAFLAMFSHEFSEQKNSKARISDIRSDVFKALLRYIYNAEIENMSELAAELLVAADKYLLEDLKMKCERFLIANTTKDNAINLLHLAKRHNCVNLELYCHLCLSEKSEEKKVI